MVLGRPGALWTRLEIVRTGDAVRSVPRRLPTPYSIVDCYAAQAAGSRCASPDPAPRRSIIGITAATAWSAGRWSARSRHRWDSCTHVPRLLLAYPGHGRRLPLGPSPVPAASGAPSPACRPRRVGTVKGAFRSTLVTRDGAPGPGAGRGLG